MSSCESFDENIILTLTKAQALVLFDFLARYDESDKLEIQNQAEQRVLWDICGDLEKTLVEPLKHDYPDIISRARDEICDK